MLEKLQSMFSSSRLTPATAYLVVLLVWAGIYLPGLGILDIDFNESRRIMPAVSMLETGNWRTPSLVGEEYFKKPPMINWLIASSFAINGERSEFAARLPSVIFVLLFVSVLVLMPSELLSLRARLMSAILFMTAYGSIDNGRQIEIDSVYACLTGIATVCWLNFWSGSVLSRFKLWIIPSLVLGAGLLLKGPLILLFFYLVVLSVIISEKKLKELLRYEHFAGIALMCLIFFSWAFFINSPQQGQSQQMAGTWMNEIAQRFNSEDVNVFLWGKRVLGAVMGYFPWLVLLPFFWNGKWVSNIDCRHRKVFIACRLAFVLPFIIVNIMPGAKARYSYPLFCLAFIMLGWLLSVQPGISTVVGKIWKKILFFILPLISSISLFFLAVAALNYFNVFSAVSPKIEGLLAPLKNTAVIFPIFVSSVLIAVFAYSVVNRRTLINGYGMIVVLSGMTVACIVLAYAFFILPAVRPEVSRFKSRLGKELSAQVKGDILYTYQIECAPFLFYVRPRVEFLLKPEQIGGDVRFLLSRTELHAELKESGVISDRKPREVFKFKIKKTEYQLMELGEK